MCQLDLGFHIRRHDVIYCVAHGVYGCVVDCVGMFSRVVAEDVRGGGAGA